MSKSCWNCKYLCLICIEKVNEPNPHFTHYSTNRCPFSSDNMISFHPHGVSDEILLNIDTGESWNDGGISSKYCEGFERD